METELLAWCAGMFEGEGTVTISSGGRKGYTVLRVQLQMTDEDVPRRFYERWGGTLRLVPRRRSTHRDSWAWSAGSATAARFLYDIAPYVRTARVREKVALALEYHEARVQGSRDPEYRARRWEFKDRMAELNRRGQ